MKEKKYEKELPHGYREDLVIDAKDKKIGLYLNIAALVIAFAIIAIGIIPMERTDLKKVLMGGTLDELLIYLVAMLAYTVLHELVHGIAYKKLTKEKLTFGISWSCAFCGVPHIYTYKKTALIAVAAPLIVFTAIFLPLVIALYFVNPSAYLILLFLFGTHLGGCSGDILIAYLLMFKYKGKNVLMNDTGPKMSLYVPKENNEGEEQ